MSITKIDKVIYTAKAHTTGGRDGGARTSDGRLDVKLAAPGGSGTGTNPEQLFAVGWSACYLSAIKLVAGRKKIRLPADAAIDTEVDLGTTDGGYFLQARLNVVLPPVGRPHFAEDVHARGQPLAHQRLRQLVGVPRRRPGRQHNHGV